VQHATVVGAEVGRDVAALLLFADDAEGSDFLEGRAEVLVDELADFGIGQSVDTQRFSVVSGKVGVFKETGNVEDEDELLLLEGLLGRFGR
jgi:hypothetical protein